MAGGKGPEVRPKHDSSQATASSLYGILSSVREGWMHHGLAPGGLSTGGCTAELAQLTDMCDYMGHAFSSDTEGMQYPVLAALYPGRARSVLTFREAGLAEAIKKAQSLGYAGAYFPWEAAQGGSDQLLITDRDQPSARHAYPTLSRLGLCGAHS